MNQIKIGNFIKQKRKEKNITQNELSELLGISNRAISKWENGNCMPDAANIPKLCEILGITINDLFSGEVVDKTKNEKRLEKNLLEMIKQKEESDKKLLQIELICGIACIIPLIVSVLYVTLTNTEESLATLIVLMSLLPLLIATPFMIKIEQKAGYYICKKCNHKYVPIYKNVFLSPHIHFTRYMKCPKCKQYSWNKKVISKGEKNDK